MDIHLILKPGQEHDEPVTLAFLHRATWLWALRRQHHDPSSPGEGFGPNPSTMSDEDLLNYVDAETDDDALVRPLIGPDLDPKPGYERVVVVLSETEAVVSVYHDPSLLPRLSERDEIYHIPVDKTDIADSFYDDIRDKME